MTSSRQRGFPLPRRSRGVPFLLGLLGFLVLTGPAPAAEERVRLTLYTGEVLEGRVYDLRNQYLEIHRALGSTRIPKVDVDGWRLIVDEEGEDQTPGLLLVLLGGHEIHGKVHFDPDTLEWVVDLAAGQARYPEKDVERTIPPSGLTSDGRFTPRAGHAERIATAIADVRSGESVRVANGEELLRGAGYFGLAAIEASLEGQGEDENLVRISLEEKFRVVIPAGIEASQPNLLDDLMTGRSESRVQVLREALFESGSDLYPLLGLLLLDERQPAAVRSFATDVLGRMHCIPELLTAYGKSEGQAQFAIAIALGDNGVYIGIPTLIEALEILVGSKREGSASVTAGQLALQRLREYSGEQFGFDPEGAAEERTAAIERWREWWIENRPAIEDSLRQHLVEGDQSPRRRRAADLWHQGMLAKARGQMESAEQFFIRSHQEDPTSGAALISLGILAYTYRQDPQGGIDYFRQALARPEAEGEKYLRRLCFLHLGRIYQMGRDYDMARKSLTKAVEIDPTYSGAWFELGMVQYQEALLIGGDEIERRRQALRDTRETFTEGVEALENYRANQSLLDLSALPYDSELPFSTRDHNRSLRDVHERLRVEIGRFHYQMAVISLALGEARRARRHLVEAERSPEPPEGVDRLRRAIGRLPAGGGAKSDPPPPNQP